MSRTTATLHDVSKVVVGQPEKRVSDYFKDYYIAQELEIHQNDGSKLTITLFSSHVSEGEPEIRFEWKDSQ